MHTKVEYWSLEMPSLALVILLSLAPLNMQGASHGVSMQKFVMDSLHLKESNCQDSVIATAGALRSMYVTGVGGPTPPPHHGYGFPPSLTWMGVSALSH